GQRWKWRRTYRIDRRSPRTNACGKGRHRRWRLRRRRPSWSERGYRGFPRIRADFYGHGHHQVLASGHSLHSQPTKVHMVERTSEKEMSSPCAVMNQFTTQSAEETVALGRKLAPALNPGSIVLLRGDLGAGKTTLVKGIAEGLQAAQADRVT